MRTTFIVKRSSIGDKKGSFSKIVKSAHGNRLRPIIEGEVEIAGKTVKAEFTLADRTHMKYRMLIGINVLKANFLVDPSK